MILPFRSSKTCKYKGSTSSAALVALRVRRQPDHNNGDAFYGCSQSVVSLDPQNRFGLTAVDGFAATGPPLFFVTNDGQPNISIETRGNGPFQDIATPPGVAVSQPAPENSTTGAVALGDYLHTAASASPSPIQQRVRSPLAQRRPHELQTDDSTSGNRAGGHHMYVGWAKDSSIGRTTAGRFSCKRSRISASSNRGCRHQISPRPMCSSKISATAVPETSASCSGPDTSFRCRPPSLTRSIQRRRIELWWKSKRSASDFCNRKRPAESLDPVRMKEPGATAWTLNAARSIEGDSVKTASGSARQLLSQPTCVFIRLGNHGPR